MFKRLRNYFSWYVGNKRALREVLERERRKSEKSRQRLAELIKEREAHEMARARTGQ